MLLWHGTTLLVVNAHETSTELASAAGAADDGHVGLPNASEPYATTTGGAFPGGLHDEPPDAASHSIQMYDLVNKYIAFSLPLSTARVRWALSTAESLLVCLHDGVVLTLQEKDWPAKLDMLYRKHLYTTALALAAAYDRGEGVLASIRHAFAEHLYSKGDYAGAAEQYVCTIGQVRGWPPGERVGARRRGMGGGDWKVLVWGDGVAGSVPCPAIAPHPVLTHPNTGDRAFACRWRLRA